MSLGSNGWIGCIRCENFWCDFMARTSALITPVQPILHRVSCRNETLPNPHKYNEMHQNMSLGSNGVDQVRSLRKFRCDFVEKTFALITLVQPILHRVSCSNETLPNAPKHYEMHQNMSLGSNGVDRVRSLRKFWYDFVARTFAWIAPVHPVLHWVLCSYETIPNAPKHYAPHQNMSLGSNGVDWVHS